MEAGRSRHQSPREQGHAHHMFSRFLNLQIFFQENFLVLFYYKEGILYVGLLY